MKKLFTIEVLRHQIVRTFTYAHKKADDGSVHYIDIIKGINLTHLNNSWQL